MNTFIEEVQNVLIAEFEKRRVRKGLKIYNFKIAFLYLELCENPKDLRASDIFEMMDWLELEELIVGKLTLKNIK